MLQLCQFLSIVQTLMECGKCLFVLFWSDWITWKQFKIEYELRRNKVSPNGIEGKPYTPTNISYICLYATVQNIWRQVSYDQQSCIYLMKNIAKYYHYFKELVSIWIYFKMYFIPEMQSWIFSIITPAFSGTWSFWNYSNMLICGSKKENFNGYLLNKSNNFFQNK